VGGALNVVEVSIRFNPERLPTGAQLSEDQEGGGQRELLGAWPRPPEWERSNDPQTRKDWWCLKPTGVLDGARERWQRYSEKKRIRSGKERIRANVQRALSSQDLGSKTKKHKVLKKVG